jgi:hypothetical protein
MKKLLIAVLICSVFALAKDKTSYFRVGKVITLRMDMMKDAQYTATMGNTTVGCNTTSTSIHCDEQKLIIWDELILDEGRFTFRWTEAGAAMHQTFPKDKDTLSQSECDPLKREGFPEKDNTWEDVQNKVQGRTFNFTYTKDHHAILVPCVYRDKKGNVKTSEAAYDITLTR